jgi:hypothetical protein
MEKAEKLSFPTIYGSPYFPPIHTPIMKPTLRSKFTKKHAK